MDMNQGRSVDRTSFQESIYSWEPAESPLDSITSTEFTQPLQDVMEQFSPEPELSPSKRSVAELRKVIQTIDGILANAEGAAWGESESSRRLPNGESVNLWQHRLLALRQHLQWVCDTFSSVPGANITLR